jgi:hypothetical protein
MVDDEEARGHALDAAPRPHRAQIYNPRGGGSTAISGVGQDCKSRDGGGGASDGWIAAGLEIVGGCGEWIAMVAARFAEGFAAARIPDGSRVGGGGIGGGRAR